jgi:hypothetical protein
MSKSSTKNNNIENKSTKENSNRNDSAKKSNVPILRNDDSQDQNKNDELKNSTWEKPEEWINILKTIKDKPTYEHIMAKVLEIYTNQLSYTNTVNEICREVKGVKQDKTVFNALFDLSEAMGGCSDTIISNHVTTDSSQEEGENDIAGEVYEFTITQI